MAIAIIAWVLLFGIPAAVFFLLRAALPQDEDNRGHSWHPGYPEAMAFRIHDRGVRGEIHNREKGVKRGSIWVEGRPEPVVLELERDFAPWISFSRM